MLARAFVDADKLDEARKYVDQPYFNQLLSEFAQDRESIEPNLLELAFQRPELGHSGRLFIQSTINSLSKETDFKTLVVLANNVDRLTSQQKSRLLDQLASRKDSRSRSVGHSLVAEDIGFVREVYRVLEQSGQLKWPDDFALLLTMKNHQQLNSYEAEVSYLANTPAFVIVLNSENTEFRKEAIKYMDREVVDKLDNCQNLKFEDVRTACKKLIEPPPIQDSIKGSDIDWDL